MSIGPSSLGNLLAQRLDTILGISQSGQVRTGAHPDALRQAQPTTRLISTENQGQRGQADKMGGKAGQAGEQAKDAAATRQDPRVASQLQRFITDSRFTASAPTTLGRTARTILALLSTQHSNQPVTGKAPLLQPRQLAQALQQIRAEAATPQSPNQSTDPKQPLSRENLPPISQKGLPTAAQKTGAALRAALPVAVSTAGTAAAAPASAPAAAAQAAAPATTAQTAIPTAINPTALAALVQTGGGTTALVNVFMQAISQNVQQSGMFYESHLAQLVKGQTTPAQLQQQPQAQAHLQAAQHNDSDKPAADKAAPQSLLAAQTATNLQQSGIEPSVQNIVRQQLEVLANQLFAWRGEAWPGVPMELEIQRHQEEEEEQAEANPEHNTPWQTLLRVELPNLGAVEARLHIDEKSLRLHLQAPEAADQLNANLPPLIQRLQAQGISIEQLQVATGEDYDE